MKNDREGHTIETLTFDIQIPKEKDYQEVADIISSITEVELPLFLQELLDTYQIKDQTIQIEKIELDLGDISLTQSRTQLISQFKNSLKKWFKETFSSATLEKSSEIKTYSLQERDFTLLKYFISYGKIPWWGLNPPFIPDESLKNYFLEATVKTKNLIFEIGQEKSTRKRIIYQF
ncbi:MAG: contractile injection system tape measure protein, partial [Bacteroidota bacterium]